MLALNKEDDLTTHDIYIYRRIMTTATATATAIVKVKNTIWCRPTRMREAAPITDFSGTDMNRLMTIFGKVDMDDDDEEKKKQKRKSMPMGSAIDSRRKNQIEIALRRLEKEYPPRFYPLDMEFSLSISLDISRLIETYISMVAVHSCRVCMDLSIYIYIYICIYIYGNGDIPRFVCIWVYVMLLNFLYFDRIRESNLDHDSW
jgi:hypothetical protein